MDWPEDELPALCDELDRNKERLITLSAEMNLYDLVFALKPFSRRFRGLLVAASRAKRAAKVDES